MQSKLTKIKHKILNPEMGSGWPAPSLAPPFVINTSFRQFELFCHFYVLNVRFLSCTFTFFNTRILYSRHLEKMAAISKF